MARKFQISPKQLEKWRAKGEAAFPGAGRATAPLQRQASCATDSSTTVDHYIKNTKQERRTAQAEKVISIRRQRTAAAATIGAGLKQASVN